MLGMSVGGGTMSIGVENIDINVHLHYDHGKRSAWDGDDDAEHCVRRPCA